MNVLVYSGSDVLSTSFVHAVTTLRSLLVPNYAVQPLPLQSLASHPWAETCSLLVFPACKTPLTLSSKAKDAVKSYIEKGGALLAFGATVDSEKRSGLSTLEDLASRMTISDEYTQILTDKLASTTLSLRFNARSDDAARIATVTLSDGSRLDGLLAPGITRVSGLAIVDETQSFASYAEDTIRSGPAGILRDINTGRTALWDAYLEYPLLEEPACTILRTHHSSMTDEQIHAAETQRQALFRSVLDRLGLDVPPEGTTNFAARAPLPQFLVAAPSHPDVVSRIIKSLSFAEFSGSPQVLLDTSDMFHFHESARGDKVLGDARAAAAAGTEKLDWQPKHIIVYEGGALPSREDTPLFDINAYFEALGASSGKENGTNDSDKWRMGEALIYGQVVTSTQTLLDKNRGLLHGLPSPTLSLASQQLSGRGRGANVWLSPAGCLQFSLLLRAPLAELPATRLVFLQYLFGLAVVEACRDPAVLGKYGEQVRLKWPNDIYAVVDGERKKIGGILVHTSFIEKEVAIVIGCGLNVLNPPPIMSLSELVPEHSGVQLSMERTAASIMAVFEKMWNTFLTHRGSFEPFTDLYLERWLHSDQLVTLTTVQPPQKVRVVGITSDHGMLRTLPEREGWYGGGGADFIDLQPDGNSFDMMAGLIKTKS